MRTLYPKGRTLGGWVLLTLRHRSSTQYHRPRARPPLGVRGSALAGALIRSRKITPPARARRPAAGASVGSCDRRGVGRSPCSRGRRWSAVRCTSLWAQHCAGRTRGWTPGRALLAVARHVSYRPPCASGYALLARLGEARPWHQQRSCAASCAGCARAAQAATVGVRRWREVSCTGMDGVDR